MGICMDTNKTYASSMVRNRGAKSILHKKITKSILIDMEKNWPFFNSTMDILDMVISKVDPKYLKSTKMVLQIINLRMLVIN